MDFKFYFICTMIYVIFPLVAIIILYKAIKDIVVKKKSGDKVYSIDIVKLIAAILLIALAIASFVFLYKVLHTFPGGPGTVIVD